MKRRYLRLIVFIFQFSFFNSIIAQSWQQIFPDTLLQSYIYEALEKNSDLRTTKLSLEQSEAMLKVAKSQQEQAQIAFEKALLVAGGEVRDALADCHTCHTREEARFLQVAAAQKAYENSKLNMQYAHTTYLEVLIAQSAWLDAQLQQTTDWLETQQSFINLYKAICPE